MPHKSSTPDRQDRNPSHRPMHGAQGADTGKPAQKQAGRQEHHDDRQSPSRPGHPERGGGSPHKE